MLHNISYTPIHHTLYTIQPYTTLYNPTQPYTLHPTPYTIHPKKKLAPNKQALLSQFAH